MNKTNIAIIITVCVTIFLIVLVNYVLPSLNIITGFGGIK